MRLEYNWEELKKHTQSDEARLLLFYCLYANEVSKSRWLAKSSSRLQERLNITDIPYSLFATFRIIETPFGLRSNYTCDDPQVYVSNCSFMFDKTPVKEKVNYLELLSLRHINDTNNSIPLKYARLPLRTNIYTSIENDRIIFNQELEPERTVVITKD